MESCNSSSTARRPNPWEIRIDPFRRRAVLVAGPADFSEVITEGDHQQCQ